MEINLESVKVSDIFNGYVNDEEDGVVGYGGKLNIRPKYQRGFVYKEDQQKSVINSLIKKFPLNVMYWVKKMTDKEFEEAKSKANENEKTENKREEIYQYEILDGQQRTMSICEYLDNVFSVQVNGEDRLFVNLNKENPVLEKQIKDTKLMIYFCEGEKDEILDWFKVVNVAGEPLSDQELRNAMHTGEWLTEAKRFFGKTKTGCPAYDIGHKYITAKVDRQGYLETAIKWVAENTLTEEQKAKKNNIKTYMEIHMGDVVPDEKSNKKIELWEVYNKIIDWIEKWFPEDYYDPMKSVDWGYLYSLCKNRKYTDEESKKEISRLKEEVNTLMHDDDVNNKQGIYEYVLQEVQDGQKRNESCLNIRSFTKNVKEKKHKEQKGVCPHCKGTFEIDEMEGDHINPWCEGGKTVPDNCQMLCKKCNRKKSSK